MGRLWTRNCSLNARNMSRLLTEQVINGINDDWIVSEILKEVARLEDTM